MKMTTIQAYKYAELLTGEYNTVKCTETGQFQRLLVQLI